MNQWNRLIILVFFVVCLVKEIVFPTVLFYQNTFITLASELLVTV